jgi:hypothetical protein
MVGVGTDEVEAAARLAGIADGDLQLRAFRGRLGTDDAQLFAVVVEVGRVPIDGDRLDVQLDGVEGQRGQTIAARGQRQRRCARKRLPPGSGPNQADVLEAGGAITDEVRARAGAAKGEACSASHVIMRPDDERARTSPSNAPRGARDAG